jgi:hypothetical protein
LNRPVRKNSVKSKKKKSKDKIKLRKVKTAKPSSRKKETDKKENNNNVSNKTKLVDQNHCDHQQQQQQQQQQVLEDLEFDEDAEAQVDTQEIQDDDSDVQFEKKLSIQSSTENETDFNNNCLDIKDVLRLLSECDDLNSEKDSLYVQGNSDSDDDLNSSIFTGNDYQKNYENYSSNSRRFEDDLYFGQFNGETDDDNDIKISNSIEKTFKVLSIDN